MNAEIKKELENLIKNMYLQLKRLNMIDNIIQFFKTEIEALSPTPIIPIEETIADVLQNAAEE